MTVSRSSVIPMAVVVCVLAVAALFPLFRRGNRQLVLYCAHDAVLAQPVIDRFAAETGITVDVRYDEEANKSLGLVNLLTAERQAPRADVFWNNQLLGTVRLQQEGVLQPYQGIGWKRMPSEFRDPGGFWAGFAARCRVFIVNTDRVPATQEAVNRVLSRVSLSDVAIAEPLFGTTLSHYCVLADQRGLDELKNWHHEIRDRGIREVRGNSMVKDLVAEGVCSVGYTDTDDAFTAIDTGSPVDMIPVRMDSGKTICIPNSVAVIAGCRNPATARRFVDFLLTEETELQLAAGTGRQVPLGSVESDRLPGDISRLREWAHDTVPLSGAARYHAVIQEWLTAESTGE